MIERLDKIRDEIDALEEADMSWANLEKLSVLYNIEHHMCKKMGMALSEGEYSGEEIGFRSSNMGMNGGSGRELREMANGLTREQLVNVVTGYGRELEQNGNSRSYNMLYNRMEDYSDVRGNNGNRRGGRR